MKRTLICATTVTLLATIGSSFAGAVSIAEASTSDVLTFAGPAVYIPPVPALGGGAGAVTFADACVLASDGGVPPGDPLGAPEGATPPACSVTSIVVNYISVAPGTGAVFGTASVVGEPEGAEMMSFVAVTIATIGVFAATLNDPAPDPAENGFGIAAWVPLGPGAGFGAAVTFDDPSLFP